jgi:hypothetical protein
MCIVVQTLLQYFVVELQVVVVYLVLGSQASHVPDISSYSFGSYRRKNGDFKASALKA